MRTSSILTALIAALSFSGCGSTAASDAAAVDAAALAARNDELVRKHGEIWKLMGLSPEATTELNGVVVALNARMAKNKAEHPEAFAAASDVSRAHGEMTHDAYIANHKKRFDALGISALTQAELIGAAEFVWTALHDPNVPAEKKKTAETIRDMMKVMSGPPPCCDDNLIRRAAE